MKLVNKKYIVDEFNRKVAVQIDIDIFEKIEELLENYALVQLINENKEEERLELSQAKEYYSKLVKSS